MSWRASQWAVGQRAGCAGAKAILLVLAEASKDCACTLSHATIAERAEVDRRTVVRQMKILEDRGLVSRHRRTDGNGHRTSDRIVLAEPRQPDSVSPDLSGGLSPGAVGLSDKSDPPKVTNHARLGGGVSQEPVCEPVFEPVALFESLPATPKPTRKKPARELPSVCPTEGDFDWARLRLEGAGHVLDLQAEAERFRDHHLAKGSVWADWSAAWRTWIGNAIRFAQERRPGPSGRGRQQSELEHALETLREN